MALKYTSFAETSIFDSQTLRRTWVLIPFWLDFDMKVVVIFFITNGNHNKCCLQLFLQHGNLNNLAQSRTSPDKKWIWVLLSTASPQIASLKSPPGRMRARLGQHSYVALKDTGKVPSIFKSSKKFKSIIFLLAFSQFRYWGGCPRPWNIFLIVYQV